MKPRVFIFLLIFIFPIFSFAQTVPIDPIKILLVPGHDDESWGTQYGTLKEADMNMRLAEEIYKILVKDKRLQVYITRDWDGYKKEFADYFETNKKEIIYFRDQAKKEGEEKITRGDFLERENVPHNTASERTSIILYGINKWANENEIDLVLHIHFNDYARDHKWERGKYRGFAVYVPDPQFENSYESLKVGVNIFNELKKNYVVSNYDPEKSGVIPDQSLIALGSNGTLLSGVKSLLVEYGYIYRFGNKSFRFRAYKDMARLTTIGIKNYFSLSR